MANRQSLVIIVDDDQAVREALQFALRLEGLCVHVHSCGATLLADPDLARAGCIVVDHRMPQMNGFELLDRVRAANPSLPAIMLTTYATTGLLACAETAGQLRLLEKPLLDNILLDTIRSILAVGGATRT